jgi:hypothetical protein
MNLPPWLHNLYRNFPQCRSLIMRDHLFVRLRKNFLRLSLAEQEAESCHWERISRPYRN